MKRDTSPGSVADLHQLLEERWRGGEVVDLIEYTRGRTRAEAAESMLRRFGSLAAGAKTVGNAVAVWAIAAIIAHDLVSAAEGTTSPGQWDAAGVVSCILLAMILTVAMALWVEALRDEES